jgi:hypothetical protein
VKRHWNPLLRACRLPVGSKDFISIMKLQVLSIMSRFIAMWIRLPLVFGKKEALKLVSFATICQGFVEFVLKSYLQGTCLLVTISHSSHLKDFSYLCWKTEMLLEIFRLVSQVPSDHTTFVPQFRFGGIHWSPHFHIRLQPDCKFDLIA